MTRFFAGKVGERRNSISLKGGTQHVNGYKVVGKVGKFNLCASVKSEKSIY
jgi:hypothetical protein